VFGLCNAVFGHAFWLQVVVFHLLKGRQLGIFDYAQTVWQLVPILLPAAILGAWASRREPILAVWLLAETGFFVLSSPTIWEHNLVELLPPAAACAAI